MIKMSINSNAQAGGLGGWIVLYHAHASVHNGIMPLTPAGRVCILLCEGGLKAMRLHIGLIHEVDTILVAQLIPARPATHNWCDCDAVTITIGSGVVLRGDPRKVTNLYMS